MQPVNLVNVFEDTRRLIRENPIIAEATERAVRNTIVYDDISARPSEAIPSDAMINDIAVEVIEDTTFSAARRLKMQFDRVGVLNFASPVNPGGGVTRGALAQEECLCRSSNLYPCLAKFEEGVL